MKTRILSLTALLAALAFLAGCEKQAGSPITPADEIMIGSAVVTGNNAAKTRLPYDGAIGGTSGPLKAMVMASINESFTSACAYGTMTFTNSTAAVAYDKPMMGGDYTFPGGADDNLYLYGAYPVSNKEDDTWEIRENQVSFNICGCEDVMLAPRVSTTANKVSEGNYSTLDFGHALTKFVILFSGNDAAVALKTTLTQVRLVKMNGFNTVPNKITLDVITGDSQLDYYSAKKYMDTWSLQEDAIAFQNLPALINDIKTPMAYIIAPFTTATDGVSYEYTFELAYTIDRGEGPENRVATINIDLRDTDGTALFTGSTAGKAWDLSFVFGGNDQITAVASVTDWDQVTTIEMPI